MSVKKTVLVVALLALSLCSLAATSFKLRHNVNVTKNFYCEFWNPATNSSITEASFSSSNKTVFATIVIFYNSNMKADISLSFTDLADTSGGVTAYCPYSLEILKPNTNESLGTISIDQNGHGKGSATLPRTTFNRYSSNALDSDEILDLAITIPEYDNLPAGEYTGSLTLTLTAR